MSYRNAFRCKKCPQSNDENGCPMWWETVWENPTSGEAKLIKSCGYTQLPLYLTEVIKASNRPAAAMEGLRNQVGRLASEAITARNLEALPAQQETRLELAAPKPND